MIRRHTRILSVLFLLICFTAPTSPGATRHPEKRLVVTAELLRASAGRSARADVLIGPCGWPAAQGPTNLDDDFTNLGINGRMAAAPGTATVAPGIAVFKNTVQNYGPNDDAFTISVPSMPAGFSVEISRDFGDDYVSMASSPNVTIPVAYRAAVTFLVRVTAPAGLKTLAGYDTVIRATSTNDPAVTNETIDRLYTGFVRLDMTAQPVGGIRHFRRRQRAARYRN